MSDEPMSELRITGVAVDVIRWLLKMRRRHGVGNAGHALPRAIVRVGTNAGSSGSRPADQTPWSPSALIARARRRVSRGDPCPTDRGIGLAGWRDVAPGSQFSGAARASAIVRRRKAIKILRPNSIEQPLKRDQRAGNVAIIGARDTPITAERGVSARPGRSTWQHS